MFCEWVLVDLVRFELTTSSMPFNKYQSLRDITAENKMVSGGLFGFQWTPLPAFSQSGLPFGLHDPTSGLAEGLFFRARLPRRLEKKIFSP